MPGDSGASEQAGEKHGGAGSQAVLKGDAAQQTLQRNWVAVEAFRVAEYFGEESHVDDLRAHQGKDDAEDHRVYIQDNVRCQVARARKKPKDQGQTEDEQGNAGKQEKPVGSVQQEKPQGTPAIAKAAQVRRAATLVGPEDDGDFADARADLSSFDDEFGGEFHSGASDIEAVIDGAGKSPHAAIAVADSNVKEKIEQRRKTGVAEIFVELGHGARFDAAAEAIAHHDV